MDSLDRVLIPLVMFASEKKILISDPLKDSIKIHPDLDKKLSKNLNLADILEIMMNEYTENLSTALLFASVIIASKYEVVAD